MNGDNLATGTATFLPAPRFLLTMNAFRVELYSSFMTAGLSQDDANICHLLSKKKTATTQQLLGELPLSKATINRRLGRLAKEGWVRVHGSGRGVFYSLEYGPSVVETK